MQNPQDRHRNWAIVIGLTAVAIRLIAINQPFVDPWSWRQSDVAAIARNYFLNGFHFAYPQIDWAGDQPGYVGTEFPILPFMAALIYTVTGVHEWIGRSEAVILFAASLPFFFLLVKEAFGPLAAVWATFLYSFAPLDVMASRCFMPDMPSLALTIVGLHFFLRWIDRRGWRLFATSAASIALSILIKAPSVIIGVPLLYAAVAAVCDRRKIDFQKSDGHRSPLQICIWLWTFALIALVPSAIWYWHAHQVAETFYPHHFFGAGGIRIENFSWYWNIIRRTVTSGLTPLLTLLAVVGLFVAPRTRCGRVFHWWFAATALFVVAVGYGNRHPWYQLPLVPIAAAFAGAACSWMADRLSNQRSVLSTASAAAIILFGILSFAWARTFYREPAANLRALGLELNLTTPRESLVVAADYGDPTVFYYAERKGWHFLETGGIYNGHPISSSDAIDDFEKLRRRGATHMVFYSGTFWWLDYYKEFAQHVDQTTTLMETPPQFKIFRLEPAGESMTPAQPTEH